MIDSSEAAEALAAIRASRTRLVTASGTPASRHLAFAALMGAWVASPVVPLPWRFAVLALMLVGLALIVRWDRRRTGMFVNGYRRGRTRNVTFALLAVCLPLYGLNVWLADVRHLVALPLALGAAATIVAFGASRYWCRVFEREMTGAA